MAYRGVLLACLGLLMAALPGRGAPSEARVDLLGILRPDAATAAAGVVTAEAGVLRLDLASAESGAALSWGPLPAAGASAYGLVVRLRTLTPADSVQLQLLVRERSGGRILQPYHKNSVRVRALPAEVGESEKSLLLSTGADTDELSGLLSFTGGPARIEIIGVELVDNARAAAAAAEAGRARLREQLAQLQAEGAGREPVLPRPLVYSRAQVKYGLGNNYTRGWIDRPLYLDRSLRQPTPHVTPLASFRRVVEIGQRYDLDGFAFFPETKGRMGVFEMISEIAPAGFGIIVEFVGSTDLEGKSAALTAALACPQAARVGDRLLITSYGADGLTPEQWREILSALRERHGDCFAFLPSITAPVALRPGYTAGEPIDPVELEAIKARLRAYLAVCDGIYFNYPAAFKKYDDRRRFDDGFYREVFIPVFKSVLAEPAHRGKLFGLSAYVSHHNADLSLGLQEDGTKTLRQSLETALAARPDVVILPEWDEQNENTSFRPTVCNGLSTLRIVRCLMAGVKGRALSPLAGDDTRIPNLVVSFRKALVLGEDLEIELLNIPDGSGAGSYRVGVTLRDTAGAAVHTFPPAVLEAGRLHDVTLRLGSEALARSRAVRPEITIEGWPGAEGAVVGEGLHHCLLRVGQNADAKWVKMPLRDVLRPTTATATLAGDGEGIPGGVTVRAEVVADRPLASLEVLEDDEVVYSLDPSDEFLQSAPGLRRFQIEHRSLRPREGRLVLSMDRTVQRWFGSAAVLHQPVEAVEDDSRQRRIEGTFSAHVRWSLAALTAADAAEATLTIDAGIGEATCRLSEVVEHGPWGVTFDDGLTVTVSEVRRPVDHPPLLGEPSAALEARLRPQSPSSVFHVRAIAIDGRIWRSAPLAVPLPAGGQEEVPLRVYAAMQGAPADIMVASARVPVLAWDIASPQHGDVLWSPVWPLFSGSLGGLPDSVTLQGGNTGHSSNAYSSSLSARTYLPGPVTAPAPRRAVIDGRACLEFRGPGAFVALPRETLPRHGAFTLEFALWPAAVATGPARCYVFAHRLQRTATLNLFVADGRLQAEYAMEGHENAQIDSGVALPERQWSMVRLERDFETLTLEVNGVRVAVPCTRPGFDIGPMAFGGFGPTPEGWFQGGLADVRVVHNVPPRR